MLEGHGLLTRHCLEGPEPSFSARHCVKHLTDIIMVKLTTSEAS